MLRWNSTLSALLFLVGMAFFTFATADHPNARVEGSPQPVQAGGHLNQGPQGVGLFNGAPVHGLADIQPELPDVLSPRLGLANLTLATPESAGTACAKPACPAPETLLRPPRGSALT